MSTFKLESLSGRAPLRPDDILDAIIKQKKLALEETDWRMISVQIQRNRYLVELLILSLKAHRSAIKAVCAEAARKLNPLWSETLRITLQNGS